MSHPRYLLAMVALICATMLGIIAIGQDTRSRETLALERIAAALEQDMRACELTDFWPPEAAEAIEKAASMGEKK